MEAPAYYLYLPPTPIKARFVLLEASTKTFYDVDTVTSKLGNPSSWTSSGLSPDILGERLAIVIPDRLNTDWKERLVLAGRAEGLGLDPDLEIGLLVSIKNQVANIVYATIIGKVNICPLRPELMGWHHLRDMKGVVLADEMENGLLEKLYGGISKEKSFVHPETLAKMPRKWHVDAAALNYELDGHFASGLMAEKDTVKWMLEEADDDDDERSEALV